MLFIIICKIFMACTKDREEKKEEVAAAFRRQTTEKRDLLDENVNPLVNYIENNDQDFLEEPWYEFGFTTAL